MSPVICAKEKEPSPYTLYVNEIIKSFTKEMQRDFGLNCMGSGGSMPYDVRSIDIMLSSYGRKNIEDARRLGVASVQRLIKTINAHEKIRPYLCQYPFTANNVSISISFYGHNNKYYLDGSVAGIGLLHGKVFYDKAEKKTISYKAMLLPNGDVLEPAGKRVVERLVDLMEESYEEALAIVEKEQEDASKSSQ